jgi:hypothetical protein
MVLVGLLIIAGVGVIAAVLVLPPRQPPPYTSRLEALPAAAPTPIPSATPTRPGPAGSATSTNVLFVGDEVAAGLDAGGLEASFAAQTGKALGWEYNIDAHPGSGYVADGPNQLGSYGSYGDRASDDAQRYPADVIVVSGGENDRLLERFGASVIAYFATLRSSYPNAQFVILEPFYAGVAPDGLATKARTLYQAAVRARMTWVDTTGWLVAEQIDASGAVSAAGQRAIAQRLTVALRRIVRAPDRLASTGSTSPTSTAGPSGTRGPSTGAPRPTGPARTAVPVRPTEPTGASGGSGSGLGVGFNGA